MTKTERYVRRQIRILRADIVSDGQVYSRGMLAAYEATLDELVDERRGAEAAAKKTEAADA